MIFYYFQLEQHKKKVDSEAWLFIQLIVHLTYKLNQLSVDKGSIRCNIYFMSQSLEGNFNDFSSEQQSGFSFFRQAPRRQPRVLNRGSKTLKNGTTFTQNTLKIQTKFSNLDQCLNKTKVFEHQIQMLDKNQKQKPSKPKKYFNFYNIIEPSFYMLGKLSASRNGKRQQTMNLNKYYCCYLRDYLRSLNTCQILDVSEFSVYQQKLQNNQLDLFEPSEHTRILIQRYINSSNIVNKILLSSKMDFKNKIIAIKYLSILKQKINRSNKDDKGWKRKTN